MEGWRKGLGVVLGISFFPSFVFAFEIVAHRGVHQTYDYHDFRTHDCTAKRIHTPTHSFIENTIPSIAEAFRLGASIVEIDIQRTRDHHLVLFHDKKLECKTNGHGRISKKTLRYLKNLDVGYGYTADEDQTYPLRGRIGMMPTLKEVLDTFPQGRFLLHQKDQDWQTTYLLSKLLLRTPSSQRENLGYWGRDEHFSVLKKIVPEIKRPFENYDLSKKCLIRYLLWGWMGFFPSVCQNSGFVIPFNAAASLRGWPHAFLEKAHQRNVKVIVIRVNSLEQYQAIKDLPIHGVMTDTIELLGLH